MRVVLLNEWFTPGMGYLPNVLSKYMAKLGVDMHVVSTDLSANYYMPDHKKIYNKFLGDKQLSAYTKESIDGFTLHRLPHSKIYMGKVRMPGLYRLLKELKPDIVQTMEPFIPIVFEAALYKPLLGYKLFTGNHTTASVFPLTSGHESITLKKRIGCFISYTLPGKFVNMVAHKCYPATIDCSEVATKYMGVSANKADICLLGVDTEVFFPVRTEADTKDRESRRSELGYSEDEIVCIYTGRFPSNKNPLLLARAIEELRKNGHQYKGLFIGDGEQADAIRACEGSVVLPFVNYKELGGCFRAADIGVWPTEESMSMLDAAACGLPVIVNDTLRATERIAGNGITYKLNDLQALKRALLALESDERRKELGAVGARRMAEEFGWELIAKRRIADYAKAMDLPSDARDADE